MDGEIYNIIVVSRAENNFKVSDGTSSHGIKSGMPTYGTGKPFVNLPSDTAKVKNGSVYNSMRCL